MTIPCETAEYLSIVVQKHTLKKFSTQKLGDGNHREAREKRKMEEERKRKKGKKNSGGGGGGELIQFDWMCTFGTCVWQITEERERLGHVRVKGELLTISEVKHSDEDKWWWC